MAFLDTIWSTLSIVDSVLDGGRSRQTSAFEPATNEDDEEEAALRVTNDRNIRQSTNAARAHGTEAGRERPAQQANAQSADRAPGGAFRSDTLGRQGEAASAAAIAPLNGAADSDAVAGAPIRPISEGAATEAQVNRRAAAIALVHRTSGEMDAAREMRARTRDLSPALAGEVIVAARATLEGIVVAFGREPGGGERVERVERREVALSAVRSGADIAAPTQDRSTHLWQIAIDVAATIEHAGRGPRGELIVRETAGLILDAAGHGGDEYRLSAFARGVPFGIGVTLPLALAEELARQGDGRRRRQMLLAIEQGLTRLKHRIAAAVSALAELTLPLAGFLASELDADAIDRDRLAAALRDHVAGNAHFLDAFAHRMDCVEAVGNDAFRTLEALARRTEIPAELSAIRSDLLDSPATAFAIAQSVSAREAVLRRGTAGDDRQAAASSIEMTIQGVRRIYAALGFSGARSALLADATVTWRSVVQMDAGWTASACSPDASEQGRVFDALLRFFGAGAPRQIRAVELPDVDGEELVHPACGLSLLRRLEQTA